MRFSVAIVGLLVMAGCIDPDAYQKPLTELDIDDTLSIVFIEPRESLILNEAWFSSTDPVTGEDWSIRDKWDTVYVNRERGVWVMCRLKTHWNQSVGERSSIYATETTASDGRSPNARHWRSEV